MLIALVFQGRLLLLLLFYIKSGNILKIQVNMYKFEKIVAII